MRRSGTPYKRVKTGFVVVFHRPKWEEGEGLEKGGQESRVKTIQKTDQKTTQKQDAILFYLKEHPIASREELTREMKGITESGIKYNLMVLQKKGLLKRVGPAKGGHWEVVE